MPFPFCRVFALQTVGFLHSLRDSKGYGIVAAKQSLRQQIFKRITKAKRDVFLTREFCELRDEDQVIRALRELVADHVLVRLGKGVYAKARVSNLSGRVVLASPGGFQAVAQQALTRLGVQWEPTDAQRAFTEKGSTQIPVNAVVKVKGPFARKLRYGNNELILDR